jgi:hypothetical protein
MADGEQPYDIVFNKGDCMNKLIAPEGAESTSIK